MNKHVNKVQKATGRAEAITAGRQQNKQQYLIIQLVKKKESIVKLMRSSTTTFRRHLHEDVFIFYLVLTMECAVGLTVGGALLEMQLLLLFTINKKKKFNDLYHKISAYLDKMIPEAQLAHRKCISAMYVSRNCISSINKLARTR